MKQARAWLNEKEHKKFKKIAEKYNTTTYGITKKLLKQFLENEKAVAVIVPFWLLCYSLAATTLVLI